MTASCHMGASSFLGLGLVEIAQPGTPSTPRPCQSRTPTLRCRTHRQPSIGTLTTRASTTRTQSPQPNIWAPPKPTKLECSDRQSTDAPDVHTPIWANRTLDLHDICDNSRGRIDEWWLRRHHSGSQWDLSRHSSIGKAADRVPQGWRTGLRARSCRDGACLCTGVCQHRAGQICPVSGRSSPSRLGKARDRPPASGPRSSGHAIGRSRAGTGTGPAGFSSRRETRAEHAARSLEHPLSDAHGGTGSTHRQEHVDTGGRDDHEPGGQTQTERRQADERRQNATSHANEKAREARQSPTREVDADDVTTAACLWVSMTISPIRDDSEPATVTTPP